MSGIEAADSVLKPPTELFPPSWLVRAGDTEQCRKIRDTLIVLNCLSKRLLYEIEVSHYGGDRPICLPPLPNGLVKIWDRLDIVQLLSQRFGWLAQKQEDGSILLTPITIEPEDLEP